MTLVMTTFYCALLVFVAYGSFLLMKLIMDVIYVNFKYFKEIKIITDEENSVVLPVVTSLIVLSILSYLCLVELGEKLNMNALEYFLSDTKDHNFKLSLSNGIIYGSMLCACLIKIIKSCGN